MEIYTYTAASHMGPHTESHLFTVPSLSYASPIHTHDFYELFLVTKGKARHMVNDACQPVAEGTLVFIRPHDIHYYEREGDHDCEFINICYTRETMNHVFSFLKQAIDPDHLLSTLLPPITVLPANETDRLKDRLERIRLIPDKPQAAGLLRAMLVELLMLFFWKHQRTREDAIPLWLESLLLQMQRKENFVEGVRRMYELSGRSPGHLNRVFRTLLHTTPVQYINQLRLDYAQYMLATTNLGIMDIALSAGFNNLSHYYHLFKKEYGLTPLAFRSIHR
ncbi:helix-turn-helix domain-containing protein [Paenibacillus sp. HN-1]|nr:AraC family transcriptional regulator [Paenibacillus sp. CGMCC 1.18879]MBY9079667.1 helix-turn-helix domain-containing protein [Paenibacillus sp. CGMCC 1.18879]MBY9082918.1 helix-turn-helix domain-containing protein [Paenibacillus sinensis]